MLFISYALQTMLWYVNLTNEGCDERKFSCKPKELMIMFIRGVNPLWPMISFMLNDDLKFIQKGTLS